MRPTGSAGRSQASHPSATPELPVAGGWIRLAKDLPSHPAIRRMARQLAERERSQGCPPRPLSRYVATCVGAVGILWITADGHIDQEDVLALGPADIDELTGLEGLCDLMPAEWLQVVDPHHVKLPGFQAHNGPAAKKRAQAAQRQQRYRDARPLRKRH
jgi:hypothetical protein